MPESSTLSLHKMLTPLRSHGEDRPRFMTKLLVVDDHPCVRDSISMLLPSGSGIEIVAEAGNLQEAVEATAQFDPDIVLLDLILPDGKPPITFESLRRVKSNVRIIVITGSTDEQTILRALDCKPNGFVNKMLDPLKIRECILAVASGQTFYCNLAAEILRRRDELTLKLTPREMEVLKLVAAGHSSKEIGTMLSLGTRTIESHRAALMTKLQVTELASLVRAAIKMGLIES